jgi:hypothetical protein
MLIYALIFIFIGLPMRALIITGLYNNIPFEHYISKSHTTSLKKETESKNSK